MDSTQLETLKIIRAADLPVQVYRGTMPSAERAAAAFLGPHRTARLSQLGGAGAMLPVCFTTYAAAAGRSYGGARQRG